MITAADIVGIAAADQEAAAAQPPTGPRRRRKGRRPARAGARQRQPEQGGGAAGRQPPDALRPHASIRIALSRNDAHQESTTEADDRHDRPTQFQPSRRCAPPWRSPACGADDPGAFIASAETYLRQVRLSGGDHRAQERARASRPTTRRRASFWARRCSTAGDRRARRRPKSARRWNSSTRSTKSIRCSRGRSSVRANPRKLVSETGRHRAAERRMRALKSAPQLAHRCLRLGRRRRRARRSTPRCARAPTNVSARVAQVRLIAVESDLPGALELVDAVLAAAPDDRSTR